MVKMLKGSITKMLKSPGGLWGGRTEERNRKEKQKRETCGKVVQEVGIKDIISGFKYLKDYCVHKKLGILSMAAEVENKE